LQPFWINSPEEWFFMAEATFEMAGVVNERVRFLNVLKALPEHVVRSINDLLQPGAPADVYDRLRQRLLDSHGLTAYQRLERLATIQGLGGQKPSELLSVLMQLCPPGEANSVLFRFEFLKRMPRELRVALAEDAAELPALVRRADVLWAHNARPAGGTLAAITDVQEEAEDDPAFVFALQPAAQAHAAPPVDFPRAGTGMCYSHFIYGDRARKCTLSTCSWLGGN